MISAPIFNRTRPYSDRELYLAVMAYLENRYVFRKLEIDQWWGVEQVIFKHRDEYYPEVFNSGKTTEEIWQEGEFREWRSITPLIIKNICSEFIFQNGTLIGKNRKTLIKNMISAEVSHGSLIETIKFNHIIKKLIDGGRQKVTGVKPLSYTSPKREKVVLNEGDLCYFCWHTKNPYVANPAYVFRKLEGSYLLLFFTNQGKDGETSLTTINTGHFINAPADELGLIPEQAVLQRFC